MVLFKHSFILLFDIFSYTLCNKGVCFNEASDWLCCDNYEYRERMCVECQPGYSSSNNGSCESCQDYYYGKRCAENCACTETERCDNVNGCLSLNSKSEMSTDILYKKKETSSIISNSITIAYTSIQGKLAGKCRSDVKIAVSGSVGLFMGVSVSVMFMFVKKCLPRNKRTYPTIGETNTFIEIQGETVNAYEEIADIILVSHDANINQDDENSDTSSISINTEERSENNHNTDYLNPYQPIIPTTDHHLYMTTVSIAACCNTDLQGTAVDLSSFSNGDNTDGSWKSDSDSLISRPLHYVELEMNTTMSEDNKVPDKYVNTRIYANQPTENKVSTQKTQYAEIMHQV